MRGVDTMKNTLYKLVAGQPSWHAEVQSKREPSAMHNCKWIALLNGSGYGRPWVPSLGTTPNQ